MTVGAEHYAADRFLRDTLAADATIAAAVGTRIYVDQVPQGTALPYVLIAYQGGGDVTILGYQRIMVRGIWSVKLVAQASSYAAAVGSTTMRAVAQRIDALLHGSEGSNADGQIASCVRTEAIRYPEVDSGVEYRHVGGRFRLEIIP